jgi:transcriptional regulator with XRE-family HTH domain
MSQRTFAQKLQEVIDATPGLTPAGLAVKAGLNNSAIRSLLSGKAQSPRLDTAMKICAALGTTLEEFMGQARTAEERDILRLVAELPEPLRRQIVGYAQRVHDSQDHSTQPSEE